MRHKRQLAGNFFFALFANLLLLAAAHAQTIQPAALSARDIARKAFPSVVVVVADDENDQPVAMGSGFFVRGNAIATNQHVIESGSRLHARIVGRDVYHDIAGIESVDVDNDLVVLRAEGITAPALPLGDSSKVEVGDEVYVVGNPSGLEGTFSQGIVSAIREITGKHFIQITAPISHGSSGGPVLNNRGEVIGIATSIFEDGQNLNFAIPVSYLGSLMKKSLAGPIATEGVKVNIAGNRKGNVGGFFGNSLDGRVSESAEIETYLAEIRAHPESFEARIKLGGAYYKQGRFEEAIKTLNEARSLKPEDPIAPFLLGLVYAELGRLSEAIEAFKDVTRKAPNDPVSHFLLALGYAEAGRNAEAKEAFIQAIRLKPDFGEAHLGLGLVYLGLGDKGAALDEYRILKNMNQDLAAKLFSEIYK